VASASISTPRTVHSLLGSSGARREETNGLRACSAALQQELGGLTLKTRSTHGHVTGVGLIDTVGQPAACGAMFGRAWSRQPARSTGQSAQGATVPASCRRLQNAPARSMD